MKTKTKEAKEYHSLIHQELGCTICGCRPVHVHHMRAGAGMGQKASDFDVYPLCPWHHTDGRLGEAVHAGTRSFVRLNGREEDLVNQTKIKMCDLDHYTIQFFLDLEEKGLTNTQLRAYLDLEGMR